MKEKEVFNSGISTEIIASDNNEMLISYNGNQKHIELPFGVKIIGSNAFADNSHIESVVLPSSVTQIKDRAFFKCTSLRHIIIMGNVIEIEEDCFYGCECLDVLRLPQGTKRIGKRAFDGCKSLKQIIIPSSVKCIEEDTFYGCTKLKDVVISEGVKKICRRAFNHCESLYEIFLPFSIECVEAEVFSNLKRCHYDNPATVFEEDAFKWCGDDFMLFLPQGAIVDKVRKAMPKGIIGYSFSDLGYSPQAARLCSNIVPCMDNIQEEDILRGLDILMGCHYKDDYGDGYKKSCRVIYTNGKQSLLGFEDNIGGKQNIPKEYRVINGTKYICDHAFWLDDDRYGTFQNWEYDHTNVCPFEKIELPPSIVAIGRYAFAGTRIKTVELPNHVFHIDDFAFRNCVNLTMVTIPHEVSFIGRNPFKGAKCLKDIKSLSPHYLVVSDCLVSQDTGRLIHCFHHSDEPLIIPSIVKSIGEYAFECAVVHSIVIPNNVLHVERGAFMNNPTIEEVIFEGEDVTIEEEAFCGCAKIRKVVLPTKIEKIERHLFKGCSSLKELEIPSRVREVGVNPFIGTSLERVVILSGDLIYENGILYSKDKSQILACINSNRTLTIEPAVNEIAEEAFSHCMSLESVIIPSSVTVIRREAFSYCKNLKYVSVEGNRLKIIESSAFSGYNKPIEFHIPNFVIKQENGLWWVDYTITKNVEVSIKDETWTDEHGVIYSIDRKKLIKASKPLDEYTILEGTNEIGDNAFSFDPWAPSLNKLTIPNSVEMIGNRVFAYCRFHELIIPESVKAIGNDIIVECIYLKSVTLPSTIEKMDGNPFRLSRPSQYSNYKPYAIINKSNQFNIIDGMLCSFDRKRLISCLYSNKIIIRLPEIKIIDKYSCADCTAREVHIPNTVEEIDDYAFYNAAMERIILPESLTRIGRCAFSGCGELRNVHIPQSVKIIEKYAFGGYWLSRIYISSRNISIAEKAFSSEKLSEIYVPYGCLNYFRNMLPEHERIIKESPRVI